MRSSSPIKALVFCCVAFLIALASRVLIPYYQKRHDAPLSLQDRRELTEIKRAIDRFVEQNPEQRFPSNLTEVATVPVSATSKFVYLPPPPNAAKKELFGRVVLVEKLGHYKYGDGGVWETAD